MVRVDGIPTSSSTKTITKCIFSDETLSSTLILISIVLILISHGASVKLFNFFFYLRLFHLSFLCLFSLDSSVIFHLASKFTAFYSFWMLWTLITENKQMVCPGRHDSRITTIGIFVTEFVLGCSMRKA